MDEKKIFKISCVLLVISAISTAIGYIFDVGGARSAGLLFNVYGVFMVAGIVYGWFKTKDWKLPFTFIGGPVEIAVLLMLRFFFCMLIGSFLFISAIIKHLTGRSKDE